MKVENGAPHFLALKNYYWSQTERIIMSNSIPLNRISFVRDLWLYRPQNGLRRSFRSNPDLKSMADKGSSSYLARLISVRGTVKSVFTIILKSVWVTLEGNIQAEDFGDFLAMAQSCKIGEVMTIDGFLEDLSENQTFIEPEH